jgi:hypothetical protein
MDPSTLWLALLEPQCLAQRTYTRQPDSQVVVRCEQLETATAGLDQGPEVGHTR